MIPTVFDASTLILLAKIDLLRAIGKRTKVVIPHAVEHEGTRSARLFDAQYIRQMIDEQLIHIVADPAHGAMQRLRHDFHLGTGEVACLALAISHRWVMATDDGQAIKACKVLGVPFTTALGLLVRSVEEQLITREGALAKLEQLKSFGWYAPTLIERIGGELTK